MNKFECVLIDFDDTIYPESSYFLQIFLEYADRRGISGRDVRSYVHKFELVRKTEVDIFSHFLLSIHKHTKANHNELFELYTTLPTFLTPYEGLSNIVQTVLDHRVKISVVTNGVPMAQRNKWSALALPRKSELSFFPSRDLFGDKPDSQTFELWREKLDVRWDRVLAIGDNYLNDLAYPVAVGATGILVDSKSITGTNYCKERRIWIVSNLTSARTLLERQILSVNDLSEEWQGEQ